MRNDIAKKLQNIADMSKTLAENSRNGQATDLMISQVEELTKNLAIVSGLVGDLKNANGEALDPLKGSGTGPSGHQVP